MSGFRAYEPGRSPPTRHRPIRGFAPWEPGLGAVDAAGNVLSGADPSTAFVDTSITPLPGSGEVLPYFQADRAHTSQWQLDPRSPFNQGLNNGKSPDQILAANGITATEADLAFAKAQLDGWGSDRATFDYWSNNPPELRWAAQVYEVGGPALALARGLPPTLGATLLAWARWLAAWQRTFPGVNPTRWTLAGFLQGLRLIPASPSQQLRPEGSASAGVPGIPGGNPVTHEFIPLSFLSRSMSYTDRDGVTTLALLDGRRWSYIPNADGTVNLQYGSTPDGTGRQVQAAPADIPLPPPIPYVPGSKIFVPVQGSGLDTTILLPGATTPIPLSQYTGPNSNPVPGQPIPSGVPPVELTDGTLVAPPGTGTIPAVETNMTSGGTPPASAGFGGLIAILAVVGIGLTMTKGRR